MLSVRPVVLGVIFITQMALLTIGIGRDYRLKHEDNNALHATFARSHLQLGFAETAAHNYFYSPTMGTGLFYPNHPPGPALALAVVYGATGSDGPLTTRATAAAFHVLAAWFFYGLVRRVLKRQSEVVGAMLLFVVLPESAFFGRMLNHEVLVLPAAILLARAYWEALHGESNDRRWIVAIAVSSAWAALAGWAGFFVIGACAAHACREAIFRGNARSYRPLAVLCICGSLLFALDILHLALILGGNVAYLRDLLASRMGAESNNNIAQWLGRVFELHWRYFGLTSAVALGAVAFRAARANRSRGVDHAVDVASIFLLAGAGYVGVFSFNATAHDYWQFLLLPASAISIVLAVRFLRDSIARSGGAARWRVLLVLAMLDISVTTTVTLVQRHSKSEAYSLRVVEELRRTNL